MPNPTWPASLPQYFDVENFAEQFPETAIRTETEVGPAKTRRRFTKGVTFIRGQLQLDNAQRAALLTFFDTTCLGGSIPFDWIHPITGAAATYRFVQTPQLTGLSYDHYKAQLLLDIAP